MTKREMYEAIIAGNINDEVVEMAKAEIVKMNDRNARRASKPSKTAEANIPIKESIVKFLTDKEDPIVASEIGKALEISTQKASALCRQLVADGSLTTTEVKVKGKGKQKGYKIV